MSFLLRRFVSIAARRALFDPRVREVAAKAARSAVSEARLIVQDEDRPRAAGRSLRRFMKALQESEPDARQDEPGREGPLKR